MNVGGRRVAMATLIAAFEHAGATDVRTYVQSGNVVFASHASDLCLLESELEERLAEAAGFAIPVVLRTRDAIAAIVEQAPFPTDAPTALHVAFGAGGVPAERLAAAAAPTDRFLTVGDDVYLHLPHGFGRSRLAAAVGKAGGKSTVRNWRTIVALAALAGEP